MTKRQVNLFVGGFLLAIGMGSVCSATSIQFDFNTAQGAYTGINAPAQAVGALGASDTQWNSVSLTAPAGGFNPFPNRPQETMPSGSMPLSFVDTQGGALPGIQTDFGAFFVGGPIDWTQYENFLYDFSNAPIGNSLMDTALMQDMIFNSYTEANTGVVGFRVSGLAPGTYDVFGLAANGTNSAITYNIRIGANMSTLGDDTPEVVGPWTGFSTWVQGKNYGRSTVTIGSTSDWITIFSSTNGGSTILNGVQIVGVPEPSSVVLCGFGLVGLVGCAWRRRRQG